MSYDDIMSRYCKLVSFLEGCSCQSAVNFGLYITKPLTCWPHDVKVVTGHQHWLVCENNMRRTHQPCTLKVL